MPDVEGYYELTTPLGPDALALISFEGEEGLSRLFSYRLELIGEDENVDLSTLIDQPVTLTLNIGTGDKRHVNGIATSVTLSALAEEGARVLMTVEPTLAKLGLGRDCRVFQDLSVPDLVKEVLTEYGVTEVKVSTTGSYEPREYCIQYRESALAFISRLLEEEGIFYYFEHDQSSHTLVLVDAFNSLESCPGISVLKWADQPSGAPIFEDHLLELTWAERLATEGVKLNDFDYLKPTTDLLAGSDAQTRAAAYYDYPGGYVDKAVGEAKAKIDLEQLAGDKETAEGQCRCRSLIAGYRVEIEDYPRAATNQEYVLLAVTLSGSQSEFSSSFVALPFSADWRPPQIMPRPLISSTQTAMVVGASGEEITTEQYGRVKVQFHWDREGQNDEGSSCWVRVAQPWSGKGWGAWFVPRIGMEVVVAFIEGNPDKPLVVGTVYNAQALPPYKLPDNSTTSGVLTRSSKAGEAGNEVRFVDEKDSELLFVHAQKDMQSVVENAREATIKEGDDSLTVEKGSRSVEVSEGDESLTVAKGKRSVEVSEGDESLTVGQGNRSIEVSTGDESHTVAGKRDLSVDGAHKLVSGGGFTHEVTGDFKLQVSGKLQIEADGGIEIKTSSGAVTIEAGQSLTLKGLNVELSASASLKAAGSASVSISGGIVKIN